MDLGFAGLIQKIEERFGTFVASALLLALILLVFAWIIETIFSLYVSGTSLWENNGESSILGLAKMILVHIILIFITIVVIYAIIRRIKSRAIRQANQRVEEAFGELREFGDEQARGIRELGDEQAKRNKGRSKKSAFRCTDIWGIPQEGWRVCRQRRWGRLVSSIIDNPQ